MQEHYYSKKPAAVSSPESIRYSYMGRSFTFRTDSGVFGKTKVDRGTDLLLEALEEVSSLSFLDMGCGYGPVGICYGAMHPEARIFMADINERACRLAAQNAPANDVVADVRQSDGFEALLGLKFECIAMNPPIRAGKEVLRKLMNEAKNALEEGGGLYIVIRTRQGAGSMRDYLQQLFGNCEEPERGSGYRVLECRKTSDGA
jgi:16S rRNA (guanine1207-N2)-methyltransferase